MSRILFSSVRLSLLRALFAPLFGVGMLVATSPVGLAQDAASEGSSANVTVDTFDEQEVGEPPDGWVFVESDRDVRSYEEARDPGETMVVKEEDGDHFVRIETKNEALRYSKRNGVDFEWNLNTHPRISWRWRALHLPEGASEKGENDTGGAIYVTFGTDWLGRPKSIKYTYSSSLPVGTVVDFGNLYVIVVDSAREPRMGDWQKVTRNVRQDYRQVFGGSPPDRPVSITLWSDSDTTDDWARVDVDDIEIQPAHRSN